MTRLLPALSVVLVSVVAATGACLSPPVACTLEARSSLAVSVADDAGAPVADATVTAALQGGETKTCESSGNGSYFCDFFEVEGTFTVTATRGADSDSATVDVVSDECHVITEAVALVLPAA